MRKEKQEFHIYSLDTSKLQVPIRTDELSGQRFLQIPDLEENKVYTDSGFLWVSVVQDGCLQYESDPPGDEHRDCGSCRFLRTEQLGDIIGICLCEKLRKHIK